MLGLSGAQNLRISDAQNRLIGRHVARSGWSDLPDLQGAKAGGSTAYRESRRVKRCDPVKQAMAKFASTINQALARFAGRDGTALGGIDWTILDALTQNTAARKSAKTH